MSERNVERRFGVYAGVPDKVTRVYMDAVPLTMDADLVEVSSAAVHSSSQFEVSSGVARVPLTFMFE